MYPCSIEARCHCIRSQGLVPCGAGGNRRMYSSACRYVVRDLRGESSELKAGDPRRRACCVPRRPGQRRELRRRNIPAIFQDLGTSPATTEAARVADWHGCLPRHRIDAADAVQAYVQADLKGTPTCIVWPREEWPASWFNPDGSCKYRRPACPLEEGVVWPSGQWYLLGTAYRRAVANMRLPPNGGTAVVLLQLVVDAAVGHLC